MSQYKAQSIIYRNNLKLRRHRSGDPQWELDQDVINTLQDEIDRAEMYLGDIDDKYDIFDRYEDDSNRDED